MNPTILSEKKKSQIKKNIICLPIFSIYIKIIEKCNLISGESIQIGDCVVPGGWKESVGKKGTVRLQRNKIFRVGGGFMIYTYIKIYQVVHFMCSVSSINYALVKL